MYNADAVADFKAVVNNGLAKTLVAFGDEVGHTHDLGRAMIGDVRHLMVIQQRLCREDDEATLWAADSTGYFDRHGEGKLAWMKTVDDWWLCR